MPVKETTENWYFLSAIEVVAPKDDAAASCASAIRSPKAICRVSIAIIVGPISSPGASSRAAAALCAVINQGIGGNRILHDLRGESALRRFDRDVLAQTGVSHVIAYIGTNDLRNQRGNPGRDRDAGADDRGLEADRACARGPRGSKSMAPRMIPYENETYHPGAWTPAGEAKRQAINEWIRQGGAFDAVIDFDAAVRDPAHPTAMLAAYDCGDHLHPSDNGYRRMGDSIDLALFD